MSAVYWASLFSRPVSDRDAFKRAHEDWLQSLNQACRILPDQFSYAPNERQCVLNAFRTRIEAYRARLRGDALAETRLSPEQHAQLQSALAEQGFLDGNVDGEFGPRAREAIKRYQDQFGEPQDEFLTSAQRARLAQAVPPAIGPNAPALSAREAENQCQSDDTDKRLAGCTAIINAKGKGFSVTLADAFDGRCRSYNDLGQYQRGVEDCKAAIALSPRHAYAFNNLANSLIGLGDVRGAIDAYTRSIDLKPTFIYSYLGRAKVYGRVGNKEGAKVDLDRVLAIEPGNQQAEDEIASLGLETSTLKDARLFLDDVQEFIAGQPSAFPSIAAIATAATELQVALKKFDEGTAVRAKARLNDILTPINGFAEYLKSRAADRQRVLERQFALARAKGDDGIYFVDEYVRRHIGNPESSSLLTLKGGIENSFKPKSINQSSIEEINKAIGALDEFISSRGLSEIRDTIVASRNSGTMTPARLPVDTGSLRDARTFLEDGQEFLKTQTSGVNCIAEIAQEATKLLEAIANLDETGARQSQKRLNDILTPINLTESESRGDGL
jgi:tetratricopeptide (TPR) repeat protein